MEVHGARTKGGTAIPLAVLFVLFLFGPLPPFGAATAFADAKTADVDPSPAAQAELARADSLDAAMRSCWQRSDYSGAATLAQRQLDIRRMILGDVSGEVASSHVALGYYRQLQGDGPGAVASYQAALDIYRKLNVGAHPTVVYVLQNLGTVLYAQGRYDLVLPLWRERLKLARELHVGDNEAVAQSLDDLATLHRDAGDYAEAEPLQVEALAMRRRLFGDANLQTAGSVYNLALLYHDMGDYAVAENLHLKALSLYRQVLAGDHIKIARSLDALAALRTDLGQLGEAEPLQREALAMRRRLLPPEHRDIAGTLNNLANLLDEKREFTEATALYREALRIKQKLYGDVHPELALNLHNLALCHMQMGELAAADSLFNRELVLIRRTLGDCNRSIAECYHDLGRNLRLQGRWTEARDMLERAISLYRALLGEGHPYLAWALTDYALCCVALGQEAEAELHLARAVEVYEVARRRTGTGYVRSTFQESPYWLLAAVRLRLGLPDAAWQAVESALGRSLAELMMSSGRRHLSDPETAREDSLLRALRRHEERLAACRAAAAADSSGALAHSVETTLTELLGCEAEWRGFQQEMSRKYPVAEGRPFSLKQVQATLGRRAAIVGWLEVDLGLEDRVRWAYVLRNAGPVSWFRVAQSAEAGESDAPGEKIDLFCRRLQVAANWPVRVPPDEALHVVAGELWRAWVAPMAKSLEDVEHLIVISPGPLVGIPVEALEDDSGHYLDETFTVSYAPSATVYAWLATTDSRSRLSETHRALLVGNPAYGPERAPLQWSQEEVAGLAILLPEARALTGRQATEANLCRMVESQELQHCGLLHFATHAVLDDVRPELSALLLSQEEPPDPLAALEGRDRFHDGRLTAKEIVRQWVLRADLVTLSGCRTALGSKHRGEGFIGIGNAFFQAGARSLLTSLWRVEDESTAKLMDRFYRNFLGRLNRSDDAGFQDGMPKAEALREAKRWLRNTTDRHGDHPYEHPVYWAGFVLSGSP